MVKKPSACHVGVGSCVAEASKPANGVVTLKEIWPILMLV